MGRKKGLVHCYCMINTAFMENTDGSSEAEIETYFDPAVPPTGVYAKVMQSTAIFIAALFTTTKKGKSINEH